jgi:cytochrome d ubiquinol oxidase subunit I
MVACGLLMLAVAWLGSLIALLDRLDNNRFLLKCVFASFPLPFIATLTGWYTAEVGRQPWAVYGVLRTSDALSPHLTLFASLLSLSLFCAVYLLIFSFGTLFIYRLLRDGPAALPAQVDGNAKRPLALAGDSPGQFAGGENAS